MESHFRQNVRKGGSEKLAVYLKTEVEEGDSYVKWARGGDTWAIIPCGRNIIWKTGVSSPKSERRNQWHEVLRTDRQGLAMVYQLHSLAAGHHQVSLYLEMIWLMFWVLCRKLFVIEWEWTQGSYWAIATIQLTADRQQLWRCRRMDLKYILEVEGFPGGSAGKESTCNVGDLGLIPGLGRSPGEGKGYLLQYSGLENSSDCISPWGLKELDTTEQLTFFTFNPYYKYEFIHFYLLRAHNECGSDEEVGI